MAASFNTRLFCADSRAHLTLLGRLMRLKTRNTDSLNFRIADLLPRKGTSCWLRRFSPLSLADEGVLEHGPADREQPGDLDFGLRMPIRLRD